MSFLKDPLHKPVSDAKPGWAGIEGRREPGARHAGEPVDSETREVVETFEKLYAEFVPPPEPRDHVEGEDAFAVELPDDLPGTSRPVPPTARNAPASGVHSGNRRVVVAAAPQEAFSFPARRPAPQATPVAERDLSARPRVKSPAPPDWSTRSRTAWPRLLVAAAVALIIGVSLGYIAGRTPAPGAAAAKIERSPDGGSRLRFDYELHKR